MIRPWPQGPEGPRQTTGLTGWRRKAREGCSLPFLMGREASPPSPFPDRTAPGRGRGRNENAVPVLLAECWMKTPGEEVAVVDSFWLVAPAGRQHPFPSRTRPLRAPAAMILRSRARESSAPPAFFSKGAPVHPGALFFCAGCGVRGNTRYLRFFNHEPHEQARNFHRGCCFDG